MARLARVFTNRVPIDCLGPPSFERGRAEPEQRTGGVDSRNGRGHRQPVDGETAAGASRRRRRQQQRHHLAGQSSAIRSHSRVNRVQLFTAIIRCHDWAGDFYANQSSVVDFPFPGF